jgi:hypothetical protein
MQFVFLVFFYLLVLFCTAYTLFRLLPYDIDMRFSRTYVSLFFGTIVGAQNVSKVDLGWHAPQQSWINDLGQVLNSTGTHGFLFNSSQLLDGVRYGTYNWCNMPHVRKEEYVRVSDDYELVYVEV